MEGNECIGPNRKWDGEFPTWLHRKLVFSPCFWMKPDLLSDWTEVALAGSLDTWCCRAGEWVMTTQNYYKRWQRLKWTACFMSFHPHPADSAAALFSSPKTPHKNYIYVCFFLFLWAEQIKRDKHSQVGSYSEVHLSIDVMIDNECKTMSSVQHNT